MKRGGGPSAFLGGGRERTFVVRFVANGPKNICENGESSMLTIGNESFLIDAVSPNLERRLKIRLVPKSTASA